MEIYEIPGENVSRGTNLCRMFPAKIPFTVETFVRLILTISLRNLLYGGEYQDQHLL